jgi:hypothetical protein
MEYCLSGKDMVQWTKVPIIYYPDLIGVSSIFDIMSDPDPETGTMSMVLFYETSPGFGHWTCDMIKNDDKGYYIEHFDSYGVKPDDELSYIPIEFRKINKEYYPQLTALMIKSGLPITYSQYKFQKKGVGINTCGRWVSWRLFFKDFDISDFYEAFSGLSKELDIDMDQVVVDVGKTFKGQDIP